MTSRDGFGEHRLALPTGVTLFTAVSPGPPDRTLLVIHGGPDWDHTYLRWPLSRLAGAYRLIMPDLRGCGRSTAGLAPECYTPGAVVTDLLSLLDRLGVRRSAVLGFSWGGLIAQRLLAAAPDRVERLIIASSSVLPVPVDSFADWPEREEAAAAEAAVWADASRDGPELTRAAAIAGARRNVWRAESLPRYLGLLSGVHFTAEWLRPWRAGVLPTPRLPDPVAALAATGRPVLALHGDRDMIFPARLATEAAALLPGARAVVLPGAGHMAHVDDPGGWLAAVAGWLGPEAGG